MLSFIPSATGLGAVAGCSLATGSGGAVAGYFEQSSSGDSTRVGAVSGVLVVVPVLVLLVFVLAELISGLQAVGQGDAAGISVVVVLLVGAVSVAFTTGFGALGGFVGGWIAEN
ncbi:MAG: hypothetical protein J07HX5_01233 [halophilic archaeon J07HX5]|nr:MAG: hypothetical protein J07HX5_01233 [halophilic archaeon J07HX5]